MDCRPLPWPPRSLRRTSSLAPSVLESTLQASQFPSTFHSSSVVALLVSTLTGWVRTYRLWTSAARGGLLRPLLHAMWDLKNISYAIPAFRQWANRAMHQICIHTVGEDFGISRVAIRVDLLS